MKKILFNALILITLLLSLPGLLAGCKQFGLIPGTGKIVTQNYDLSGFNRIEVSSAFELEITSSDSYSVSVTAYENLFDYIEVYKTTDTLIVRMKPGKITTSTHRVVITLPALTYLDLSGASHGEARGFVSSSDLTLNISGASSLDTVITAGKSKIDLSGASKIKGSLTAADAVMEISGASRMEIAGTAQTLDIEVSGASTADMFNFAVQDAQTDVSGASTLNLTVNSKLDVEVSGASTLNYKGTAVVGKMDVTGASSFHKK